MAAAVLSFVVVAVVVVAIAVCWRYPLQRYRFVNALIQEGEARAQKERPRQAAVANEKQAA